MNGIPIATSRFNEDTWRENQVYRATNPTARCIYGCPVKISDKIPLGYPVFIVEMNNSTNKIEGIGLIKNTVSFDKYYSVYKAGNYNRYVYKSEWYIPRDQLAVHNDQMVQNLDYILFKEKTHLKRGSGITRIPEKLLKHKRCGEMNMPKELRLLFIDKFKDATFIA